VICCHAGIVESSAYVALSARNFDRTLDVNLKGAFLVSREAVRRMEGIVSALKPGRIVFTTSWVQDVPWPEIAAYCASKGAVKMLMRTLAREVARDHIRVNAVAPGIVDTGMAKRQWNEDARYRARAQHAVPLGFLQTAKSVADAFLFLASDASSYMTGATLLVDGGCSLYPMEE
ncbi:MAG: SDR family NAD(P)-dependent oxidoreductase, partial [Terriglobia bacterium]